MCLCICLILIKITWTAIQSLKNLNISFPFCSSKSCDNSHVTWEKAKTSYSIPVLFLSDREFPYSVFQSPCPQPFHVTNGPQNASCSPLRMIFQPFPLFYTKSSWLCTLFITSLSLNDVIRRYFIGAFLYDDRNHWSSFRFICRLDFMEESRENLLWHSSYCELFRDKKYFTLFMCNLSYEFLRKKIKRICLHLLVLERVIAMNVS